MFHIPDIFNFLGSSLHLWLHSNFIYHLVRSCPQATSVSGFPLKLENSMTLKLMHSKGLQKQCHVNDTNVYCSLSSSQTTVVWMSKWLSTVKWNNFLGGILWAGDLTGLFSQGNSFKLVYTFKPLSLQLVGFWWFLNALKATFLLSKCAKHLASLALTSHGLFWQSCMLFKYFCSDCCYQFSMLTC
jgi:hypothetical protein